MKYTLPQSNNFKKLSTSKYKSLGKSPAGKYPVSPSVQYKVQPQLFSEEDEAEVHEDYLGYSERSTVSTCVTIPIDTSFKSASHYRHVVSRIVNTSKDDLIEFEIHSPGGQYNGLSAILSAILRTEASTVAYLNGECHSAASMLALSCDSVQVSPFATMLCHFTNFGYAGKASDVMRAVSHIHDTGIEVFCAIYEGFLTEEELLSCIDGKEYWFDAEEIMQRLQNREDLRNAEMSDMSDPLDETTVVDMQDVLTEEELEEYDSDVEQNGIGVYLPATQHVDIGEVIEGSLETRTVVKPKRSQSKK